MFACLFVCLLIFVLLSSSFFFCYGVYIFVCSHVLVLTPCATFLVDFSSLLIYSSLQHSFRPFDRHIRQDSSNSSDALAFTESLPELPMCTRQRSSSADDERFPESVLERGSTSCVDATQAMREESNDDPVRSLFPRSQDGHSVASRRKLGVDMGSCTPEGIHSPFESSFRTGSDLSLLDNVDHSAPVLEWVGSEHQTAGSEKVE